ncbi:hypothetical protein [Nesterenkonia pannonica]|nr:hypothetical protein [Nesterenkonia pannonica]
MDQTVTSYTPRRANWLAGNGHDYPDHGAADDFGFIEEIHWDDAP